MKRIAIMNNGTLPIPSVLGGAVETLVQLLVDTNEKKRQKSIDIPIFTLLVLRVF